MDKIKKKSLKDIPQTADLVLYSTKEIEPKVKIPLNLLYLIPSDIIDTRERYGRSFTLWFLKNVRELGRRIYPPQINPNSCVEPRKRARIKRKNGSKEENRWKQYMQE